MVQTWMGSYCISSFAPANPLIFFSMSFLCDSKDPNFFCVDSENCFWMKSGMNLSYEIGYVDTNSEVEMCFFFRQ